MIAARFALLASLSSLGAASLYGESNLNHTCVLQPKLLSCPPQDPAKVDSCCVETFGGLVLATQFWDTYTGLESQGQLLPPQTWSLHGLWPDFCNGSYTQYCDLNRQYDPTPSPNTTNALPNGTVVPPYKGAPISTFVEAFGRYDLLAWMNKFWINQGAPNTDFWAHEFSKHATCFSTFDLPCYGPQYVNHSEVVEFFETAIYYYLQVPTYEWLADAGITPSNSTTYTLADFQDALTAQFGATPYLGCSGPRFNETAAGKNSTDNGRTILSETWYYHYVRGRVQERDAIPVNVTGSNTNCAKAPGAINYYLRTNGSEWTDYWQGR